MARWQDVIEAERKARIATKDAAAAIEDREFMMAYIRESKQIDTYMEWYAKRLGIWAALYGDDSSEAAQPKP